MSPSTKMIPLRRLLLKSLAGSVSGQSTSTFTSFSPACAANTPSGSFKQQQSTRSIQNNAAAPSVPASFKASDVVTHTLQTDKRAPKPAWDKLVFGHHCSDHMIKINWSKATGWGTPTIGPVENFSLHPYAKVFHYAQELFEGLKAYRGPDQKIRLFRPDLNMKRMCLSARRLCLPDFDGDELIELIKKLLLIDESWIPPYETNASMYVRPALMGTEATLGVQPSNEAVLFVVTGPVGPYFSTGQLKPVSLLANPKNVRAWPGGSGDRKLGANYAPTLLAQHEAVNQGHQQVLWLYGPDYQLTEVGTMNIFVLSKREDGSLELATPPLAEGLILPGVTRQSLIELTRSWGEFDVVERTIPMLEVEELVAQNRLLEMFGAGTACVVCPVGEISFHGRLIKIPKGDLAMRLLKELTDIQYGIKEHPWSVLV